MGLELMAKLMWTHYVASIALHYDIIISYTTVDKIVLYNILVRSTVTVMIMYVQSFYNYAIKYYFF